MITAAVSFKASMKLKRFFFLALFLRIALPPFSPHTRGVISRSLARTKESSVFPAHAGGDPAALMPGFALSAFSPHARG